LPTTVIVWTLSSTRPGSCRRNFPRNRIAVGDSLAVYSADAKNRLMLHGRWRGSRIGFHRIATPAPRGVSEAVNPQRTRFAGSPGRTRCVPPGSGGRPITSGKQKVHTQMAEIRAASNFTLTVLFGGVVAALWRPGPATSGMPGHSG